MVFTIKTILVGPFSVGKTALVTKYVDNIFSDYDTQSTIGVDFRIKNLTINDKDYRLQIWDTAGHERFQSITQSYYKHANVVIFCFSLTNLVSMFELEKMINDFNLTNNSSKPIKILVGTHFDENTISYETQDLIDTMLLKYYIPYYFSVSSKTGHNVNKVFETIINNIHKIEKINNDELNNDTYVYR